MTLRGFGVSPPSYQIPSYLARSSFQWDLRLSYEDISEVWIQTEHHLGRPDLSINIWGL